MPKTRNVEPTLRSVVASPASGTQTQVLTLTIVFHPDTRRIGESTPFDKPGKSNTRILGRCVPCFKPLGEGWSATALNDRYVSMEALRLHYSRGEIVITRDSSACRAQVGGRELNDEVRLSRAQLAAGVPIVLGGRIVVLLRLLSPLRQTANRALPDKSMLGGSAYMAKLKAQIALLAATDFDVLIRGETGTGKELVAQALHAASNRAAAKMVAVNMAAIPATLAPTLLFGSARGAFTGADKASAGYFSQAEGGTLFLDEIGETPAEVQSQLLRALQQREIQVVGGPIRKIDLRLISATDARLEEQSCDFKAALHHRLAQSEIQLLPLRQHPEDIGDLLLTFIDKAVASLGRPPIFPLAESPPKLIAMWAELFHQFVTYQWPGNIRELDNFAQQVALVSELGPVIPELIQLRMAGHDTADKEAEAPAATSRALTSEDYSDQEFLEGYKDADYEVVKTARQLGLSRQAVYRRISEFPGLCLASELSDDQIRAALISYGDDLTATALRLRVSRVALRERIRSVAIPVAG